MDGQRFDELTRHLAVGASRRQVLRALAGSVLGGLAAAFPFGRAALAAPKKRETPCATDADCAGTQICDPTSATCVAGSTGGRPPSGRSQTTSVGIAAVCATDADCAPNEACVEGVCTATGGPCVRGSSCTTDATCCGGEVCDLDPVTGTETCVGAGGPCTNVAGTCFDTLDCCGGEECVGGTCVRAAGGCTSGTCAGDGDCCGGAVCVNNTCAFAARPAGCPEGQVRCSGVCVDILTDPAHCGACGVACPESQSCVNGVCVATGVVCCDVDAGTCEQCDPCEQCGYPDNRAGGILTCIPCIAGTTCVNGICESICSPCERFFGTFDDPTPRCKPVCDPCSICDSTMGCVSTCSPCQSCAEDEFGKAVCVDVCSACQTCDPVAGCVYACNECQGCNEDTGCFDACPEMCATCDPVAGCISTCLANETCVDSTCV